MAEDDQTIHLISAHDGGNGFMNDQVNDSRYIFPSVMSEVLPGKELETIDKNSSLVFLLDLKSPLRAEVTVVEHIFSTPLISMHI